MNEGTTKKLTEDFKILIDDVEELVKASAGEAGERIGDLRHRLKKQIENGRNALAERSWFQKAREAATGTESTLREHTWGGLVMAAGIGVLLGWLLRRERFAR